MSGVGLEHEGGDKNGKFYCDWEKAQLPSGL